MSLSLFGQNASYGFRWRRWAFLRDTVEALFGPSLPMLSSFCEVLTHGPRRLTAAMLAEEVIDVHRRLSDYPFDYLMLAPQTAVVLFPQLRAERARPLSELELAELATTHPSSTLGDYFGRMCHAIAHVCANPFADGTVELVEDSPASRELDGSLGSHVLPSTSVDSA